MKFNTKIRLHLKPNFSFCIFSYRPTTKFVKVVLHLSNIRTGKVTVRILKTNVKIKFWNQASMKNWV